MPAPLCTDCGLPVLEATFRLNVRDPHPVAVCRKCRGARGGRNFSANVEAKRLSKVIETALLSRERKK